MEFSVADHDRFFDKVKLEPSGCWRWTAGKNRDGYGRFWLFGARMAHRVAFEAFRGVPKDDHLHHVCENKWCVNPAHLREMAHSDHAKISVTDKWFGWQSRKEFCKHGHEFTEENTRWADRRLADGRSSRRRFCRACHRVRQATLEAKRRAA